MPPDNAILRQVADNPQLFDALKTLWLKHVHRTKPKLEMTDELLGQITRAQLAGEQSVEDAFRELATYKTGDTGPEPRNPAR